MIKVWFNNKALCLYQSMSLGHIAETQGVSARLSQLWVNAEPVSKSQWNKTTLVDGDRISSSPTDEQFCIKPYLIQSSNFARRMVRS